MEREIRVNALYPRMAQKVAVHKVNDKGNDNREKQPQTVGSNIQVAREGVGGVMGQAGNYGCLFKTGDRKVVTKKAGPEQNPPPPPPQQPKKAQ